MLNPNKTTNILINYRIVLKTYKTCTLLSEKERWIRVYTCALCIHIRIAQGGRTRFGDIWIFVQFLKGLHGVLQISLFKIWTAHILCIEIMITLNPSVFTVEIHSKYNWYFCIQGETYFHYASRKTPCYFTLNGCAEKPREMPGGNVNRPLYHYIAAIHWTWTASYSHCHYLPNVWAKVLWHTLTMSFEPWLLDHDHIRTVLSKKLCK